MEPDERRHSLESRAVSKSKPAGDWIVRAPRSERMERIEAFFSGHGYEPHRHDTYAIGRTLAGVQSFHYRGGQRHSCLLYTSPSPRD